jgi:hypothetical protein
LILSIMVTVSSYPLLSSRRGSASNLPESAIHVNLNSCDLRGILGRKKGYGAGNFFRLPKPLHWHCRNDLPGEFVDDFLRSSASPPNWSDDWPRRHGVDADAASSQLRGRRSRQRAQSRLLVAEYALLPTWPLLSAALAFKMTDAPSLTTGNAF